MYCPKCGTQNIEEANFCRICGVRFKTPAINAAPSLETPDYERALRKLLMGIGLLIIAFIPLMEGEPIWWWLLFPGIPLIAKGVGQLTQVKLACGSNHQLSATTPNINSRQTVSTGSSTDFRAPQTAEFVPPSSVTERTTELFDDAR